MGVRFSGEMATCHLNSVQLAGGSDLLLKSARAGVRVDMMVNPLAFSGSYTPGRMGAALLLGWEVGGKVDAKYTHLDVHAYNSLSLGAQLRLLTDEDHVFYIEPRYMVDDRLVSVTAGLEYAITDDRFRSSKRQPGTFKPYYNIGIAGGVSHRFMSNISAGMPQLGASAGLSGEYHFTPYSGVRFTADYAEVTNGGSYAGKAMRVGHANTGIDYMFDLSTLFALGNKVKEILSAMPEVVDINVEQQVETPQLQIRADREKLALYGITMEEFNSFVEASFPGKKVGSVYEEERSFDLIIRLNKDYTESMEGVKRALIDTPDGKVALDDVASIVSVGGPGSISRENVQRKVVVSANIASGDVAGTVERVAGYLEKSLSLDEGYRLEYGGRAGKERG